MKKPLCRLLTLLIVFCLCAAGISAFAGNETASPNLLAAMKSLQAAKVADDPNPSLQEAMKYLDKATNNAGGKRDEAIGFVNQAIDLAKAGNKTEMVLKIDHAIALLHQGMSMGGRRHR